MNHFNRLLHPIPFFSQGNQVDSATSSSAVSSLRNIVSKPIRESDQPSSSSVSKIKINSYQRQSGISEVKFFVGNAKPETTTGLGIQK